MMGRPNRTKRLRSQTGPEKIRSLPSVPPVQEFDPKVTDMLLAAHMNSLSMKERDKVLDEIHGIAVPTPDHTMSSQEQQQRVSSTNPILFVEEGTEGGGGGSGVGHGSSSLYDYLLQFQHELGAVPNKYAYDIAYSMSPEYVTNPKLRKLFLMADNYNVKHAAVRLVSYFEQKLELFGT